MFFNLLEKDLPGFRRGRRVGEAEQGVSTQVLKMLIRRHLSQHRLRGRVRTKCERPQGLNLKRQGALLEKSAKQRRRQPRMIRPNHPQRDRVNLLRLLRILQDLDDELLAAGLLVRVALLLQEIE